MGSPGHLCRSPTLVKINHNGIRIKFAVTACPHYQRQGDASSGSKSVRTIWCKLAWNEADLVGGSCCLTHIPGKANKWPDTLSRLHAPEKSSIPIELLTIERTPVGTRDQQFWRSKKKKEKKMCNQGGWWSRLPSTYVRSGCIAPAAAASPGSGPSPSESRGRPPVANKSSSSGPAHVSSGLPCGSRPHREWQQAKPQGESRKGGAFGLPTGQSLPETGLPETRHLTA